MLIVVGLGLGFSVLYHVGVPEAHDTPRFGVEPFPSGGLSARELAERSCSMEWGDWLGEWQFYLVRGLSFVSFKNFTFIFYWKIYRLRYFKIGFILLVNG